MPQLSSFAVLPSSWSQPTICNNKQGNLKNSTWVHHFSFKIKDRKNTKVHPLITTVTCDQPHLIDGPFCILYQLGKKKRRSVPLHTEFHSTETKNASLKTPWTVSQKLDLKHDSYFVLICPTDGGDVSVVHSHSISCLLMQENNLAQQL